MFAYPLSYLLSPSVVFKIALSYLIMTANNILHSSPQYINFSQDTSLMTLLALHNFCRWRKGCLEIWSIASKVQLLISSDARTTSNFLAQSIQSFWSSWSLCPTLSCGWQKTQWENEKGEKGRVLPPTLPLVDVWPCSVLAEDWPSNLKSQASNSKYLNTVPWIGEKKRTNSAASHIQAVLLIGK